MSLSRVLEEIKNVKPLAEEDISSGPRETYAGREGRKRNAIDRMKTLKERYIEELRLSSVFIFVVGSYKDQFSELAAKEFNCFSADPEELYKDLANRLPAELYDNKTPTANLFDIMSRHLEDKANEMQVLGYPLITMKQEYFRAINGKEDFVNLIKEAINDQVGSEMAGLCIIRSLADKAIDTGHGSKITPIVLATDDEKLVLDLNSSLGRIGARSFLVAAGKGAKSLKTVEGTFMIKESTKENVENVLTTINKLCKTR